MLRFGPQSRMRLYTTVSTYLRVLTGVLSGGARRGDDVAALEELIRRRVGTEYAVAMPRARIGIYMTLKALIEPGQKVILSPYTIADVINMVICAGGVPVFADLDPETCNISKASVESLIDEDTGAVMVTHFYGLICDVEGIAEVCERHDVPMIEDAAQAFGARAGGAHAGAMGRAGIFSFGLYKNVNSFFGGMVVTNDRRLRDRLAGELSTRPFQPLGPLLQTVISGLMTDIATWPPVFQTLVFRIFKFGFLHDVGAINDRVKIDVAPRMRTAIPAEELCRMTPLQAALIISQLENVESHAAARLAAAKRYHEGLKDIDGLCLPPFRQDGSHIYWYYPIQYADRHDLVAFAMRQGVDIAESYHRNCASLPCFEAYARPCENAERTANSVIYLPTYPRYRTSEVDRVIEVIKQYFSAREC